MEPIINSPGDPPMPLYKSHKIVAAFKIGRIDPIRIDGRGCGARITPAEEGYKPFQVSEKWLIRHVPETGGYYVAYEDGYRSFSPAQPFLDGYDLIDGQWEAQRQSAAGETIQVDAPVAEVEMKPVKPI